MNPPKTKKLKTVPLPSVLLYLIISLLGAWRFWRCLHSFFPNSSLTVYAGMYLLLCALLPVSVLLPRTTFAKRLEWIGSYWTCFQLTFCFAAILDYVSEKVISNWLHLVGKPHYPLVSLVIFLFTAGITLYGAIHAKKLHRTEYACRISKSLEADPLRIVQISDLHIGAINDAKCIRKVVAEVNTCLSDTVCITGDTFSSGLQNAVEIDKIIAELQGIRSKYGVYACLGNHDYYSDMAAAERFFQQAHMKLLRDEAIQVAGVTLIGREDATPEGKPRPERKTMAALLQGINTDNPIIVLDHQPGDLTKEMNCGVDLVLSGHTHAGQFFPVQLFSRFFFPHNYGYKKFGQMHSIVTSGATAAIPPIRIGSSAEIVYVTLQGLEKERV